MVTLLAEECDSTGYVVAHVGQGYILYMVHIVHLYNNRKARANVIIYLSENTSTNYNLLWEYILCYSPALTACLHDLAHQVPQLKKSIQGIK